MKTITKVQSCLPCSYVNVKHRDFVRILQ